MIPFLISCTGANIGIAGAEPSRIGSSRSASGGARREPRDLVVSATTRASVRWRSSRSMRQTITLRLAAMAIERRVTVTSVVSILHDRRRLFRSPIPDPLT